MENWKRFENRLKHFALIYKSLEANDMVKFDNVMNQIPVDSIISKNRYTTRIQAFQTKIISNPDNEALKQNINMFEKNLHTAMALGEATPYDLLLLKLVIATPEDCWIYLFRIIRGGFKTFTPPARNGFLRRTSLSACFAEILDELLALGFNPNHPDELNRSVLHGAVILKNEPIALELIKRKEIDLAIIDNYKRPPLHDAVKQNGIQIQISIDLIGK